MITKKIIFIIMLATSLSFANLASASLKDAFKLETDQGTLGSMASTAGYEQISIKEIISSLISFLLAFLGVIFLVLTIYGGFLWMTARGNEQQVEKAKEAMTSSIIGLAIVLGAYAISYYVIYYFTNTTLKQ